MHYENESTTENFQNIAHKGTH